MRLTALLQKILFVLTVCMAAVLYTLLSSSPPQAFTFAFIDLENEEDEASSPWDELVSEMATDGVQEIVLRQIRIDDSDTHCGSAVKFRWIRGWPDEAINWVYRARRHNMKLWIGLGRRRDDCLATDGDAQWQILAKDAAATANILEQHIGESREWVGIYLPDEPPAIRLLEGGSVTEKIAKSVALTSKRPSMVSPYLVGMPAHNMSIHAHNRFNSLHTEIRKFLHLTGVHRLAWQDSQAVAPGLATKQMWDSFAQSVNRGSLCAVVELFGRGDLQQFETPPAYAAAPYTRVREQIKASEALSHCRGSWLPQRHMTSLWPRRMPGASFLAAAYRADVHKIGKIESGATITWTISPDTHYPDPNNNLLVDNIAADPWNYAHGGWVGTLGKAQFRLQLSSLKRINWIAIQTLQQPQHGIIIPSLAEVRCIETGETRQIESRALELTSTAEFLIANDQALALTCQTLEVTFINSAWTFLGEVEVLTGVQGAK